MPDVLTDIPGKVGRFWGDHTTLVGPTKPPAWLMKRAGGRWAHNLTGFVAGLRLFARRGRCHGVVTDGGSSGMIFAWLQALCPWGRKPHVMIDCLWDRSPQSAGPLVQEVARSSGRPIGGALCRLVEPRSRRFRAGFRPAAREAAIRAVPYHAARLRL